MSASEFVNSLLNTDRSMFRNWEEFVKVYVDITTHETADPNHQHPILNNQTTFHSLMTNEQCKLIIGAQGTGKSILHGGMAAYSATRTQFDSDRSIVAYIPATTIGDILTDLYDDAPGQTDSFIENVPENILMQCVYFCVITALLESLEENFPQNTQKAVASRVHDYLQPPQDQDGKSKNHHDLHTLREILLSEKQQFFDATKPIIAKLHNNDTKQTNEAVLSHGEMHVLEKTADIWQSASEFLDHPKAIGALYSALQEVDFKRVHVFFDDFSELTAPVCSRVWSIVNERLASRDRRFAFDKSKPSLTVCYIVALYRGKMFGQKQTNNKRFSEISTDLFSLLGSAYQDFATIDGKYTEYYRLILQRRLSVYELKWSQIFDCGDSDKDSQRQIAKLLYFASSGQIRNMGKILSRLNFPSTPDDIVTASQEYYMKELRETIEPYLPPCGVDSGALGSAMRIFHARIAGAFVEGKLFNHRYFGSSIAVRMGHAESLLNPLIHAGFLMKRAEIGATGPDSNESHQHSLSIYSFHFGLVRIWPSEDIIWDEGDINFHISDKKSWKEFFKECEGCSDAICDIARKTLIKYTSEQETNLYNLFDTCGWLDEIPKGIHPSLKGLI